MLFSFKDVEENLSTYLPNWINKSEEFWVVYDLYFKLYYQRCLDLNTRCLFLIQALEAYHHRMTHNDKRCKLEVRLESICNKLSQDYSEIIKKLLGNSGIFAKKAALTRHNLSHHPRKQSPGGISSSIELFDYIQKMQFLLRICFLVEMEFPPDEIKRLMSANSEYKFLIE